MKSWFAEKSAHGRRSSTLSRDCQCFQAILFVALWTNLSGISSLTLRRIVDCLYDGRRLEASLFFVDARDGTSRRCQVVARPSNAESAQKCQLVTPGFAAAVSTSGTHLVTKIPHLSAHRYPRNTCRILKSICQDAMHSVDTITWCNNKMLCICRHCSMTLQITRGPTDATSEELRPFICNIQQFGMDRGTISTAKGASNSRYFPSSNKSSLFSSLFRTGSQQKT